MSETKLAHLYIGLMSGTSADGIDLALVSFDEQEQPKLVASYYQPYNNTMVKKITALYSPVKHVPQQSTFERDEIDQAFELDVELAQVFSQAIKALLKQKNLSPADITAIGNHGQTIRHRPKAKFPYTLQIGCNQTLASLTNIRVIGQFRRKDMAYGGQGAPLTPAFHQQIFTDAENDVFVINIGGIANITYLPYQQTETLLGFDTGPGNALMDDWFQLHHPKSHDNFDKNGAWANSGKINTTLLTQLLEDNYFQLMPPKSTGREYFNQQWLSKQLNIFQQKSGEKVTSQDIQTTLTQLTAVTITNAIKQLSQGATIYLCGGGAHNAKLLNEIKKLLNKNKAQDKFNLLLTSQKGIDGDQLEAIAFAWLAYAYDKKFLSNIPAVTGASKACTLGTAFFP